MEWLAAILAWFFGATEGAEWKLSEGAEWK
jgi:hypothetical protein